LIAPSIDCAGLADGCFNDLPVWSLWCIRVRPGHRKQGISHTLIAGAVEFAREHGAASWLYLCGEEFASMEGGMSFSDVQAAVPASVNVIADPPRPFDMDVARRGVAADSGRGLGARWVTLNDLASDNAGAQALRLLTIGACVLLYLAPLILGLWRGQTTHDRHATARAERDRAELDADTAVAIKRAEVRCEAEIMWAEHQLTQARLAIEAQTEIDRQQQRRRVIEALDAPVQAQSDRVAEPKPELPAAKSDRLPAVAAGEAEPDRQGSSLIPTIPDVTKAAARWLRPFVPPIIASAIDSTTMPLRSARQVFEETEEIHFSLRRSHKVSVQSEEHRSVATEPVEPQPAPASVVSFVERQQQMMTERDGPPELRGADGPRQLPSAE